MYTPTASFNATAGATKNKPVVFYHGNCSDGFGAAFSAWHQLDDHADYVPVKYGDVKAIHDVDLLGDIVGRDVYVLDFSFPKEVMEYIIERAHRFIWLDHHKTAFEMWCPGTQNTELYTERTEKLWITLDNSRSGALIAWNTFVGSFAPSLITYIDDQDRWQFKYPDTKAFGRSLRAAQPWTFQKWAEIADMDADGLNTFTHCGQVLLNDHNERVAQAVKYNRAISFVFEDKVYAGAAINATMDIASDAGHELANITGTFGVVYQINSDLSIKLSLRSVGDYDVTEIAKRFGGGGHRNAAGCTINITQLWAYLS